MCSDEAKHVMATSSSRSSYCSVSDATSMHMAVRRSTDTDTLPLNMDNAELDTADNREY